MRGRGRAFSIQIVDEDYLYSSVSISSILSISSTLKGKMCDPKFGDFHSFEFVEFEMEYLFVKSSKLRGVVDGGPTKWSNHVGREV